jgi:hypothetical protein
MNNDLQRLALGEVDVSREQIQVICKIKVSLEVVFLAEGARGRP